MSITAKTCAVVAAVTVAIFFTPLSFSEEQTDFKKVGEARMEYLFWDVYDATLYTESGGYEQNTHPVKFKLTYLRDFAAKDIVKATKEQWQHLGKSNLSAKYADKLLSLWPDIKKGESLSLHTAADGQSTFYHNDQKLGEITDSQFANQFLAIWLSPNTSEPALRKQLLGI
ncbi:chalcone isomerase family protein [uncultured Pseudoalteromonas sp.]|uniref:chalcone isomerase family protein n=1 Tax=uncultured Pseudoalteromonas sp. TaxID=114053 RepID=UPI0030C81F57